MKNFYCLKFSAMNGTVTMHTEVTLYPNREMAEEVEKAIKEKNKDCGFGIWTQIEEVNLYESLDEVPILKD